MSFCVLSLLRLLRTESTTDLTSSACSLSLACCSKRTHESRTALTSEASATFWRWTNASDSSCAVSCTSRVGYE